MILNYIGNSWKVPIVGSEYCDGYVEFSFDPEVDSRFTISIVKKCGDSKSEIKMDINQEELLSIGSAVKLALKRDSGAGID